MRRGQRDDTDRDGRTDRRTTARDTAPPTRTLAPLGNQPSATPVTTDQPNLTANPNYDTNSLINNPNLISKTNPVYPSEPNPNRPNCVILNGNPATLTLTMRADVRGGGKCPVTGRQRGGERRREAQGHMLKC